MGLKFIKGLLMSSNLAKMSYRPFKTSMGKLNANGYSIQTKSNSFKVKLTTLLPPSITSLSHSTVIGTNCVLSMWVAVLTQK